MICLVLTILVQLFPAADGGLPERTFLAVKPDVVQRRLVGEIRLVALKLVQASEELLREHYADLHGCPFYGQLVKYMGSGPVVAMVWQGLEVVHPVDAKPGTIRGDFCRGWKVSHGSDSQESVAGQKMELWFHKEEILSWEDSGLALAV
uniref:Nucleoside diphosphate kinase A n=1 Tax=Cavia porcellus TaxID=10141 RepID=A0A286XTH7_CAVPO